MKKQTRLLTKTAYGHGILCEKLFWVYQNRRDEMPEADEATQAIFDQGHLIGDLAKSLYPDGIEIDWNSGHETGVAQTKAVLGERKPIFEAGFQHGKTHARADILNPAARGRWDLIEVKSSTAVKEEHLDDVAFQKHVYEGAGVSIGRCFVMHVDKTYVREGELDVSRLLQLTEVTKEIKPLAGELPSNVTRLLTVMSRTRCPDAPLGPHCAGCALYDECWSFLPGRHVFSLHRAGQRAYDLMEEGILEIKDIPDHYPLTGKQSIQVKCEKTGNAHVAPKGIGSFVNELKYPLHFLDFETFMLAVPPFDRMSPYEQVPFQYSLYIVRAPGESGDHHSYLSDGSVDPRPEVLNALKKKLGKRGSIIAYNASFEIRVLESCARHFPEYAAWLESIRPRIVDLYAPFRDFHFYHPGQNGSASLKVVMPALTGRNYDGLQIADGQTASRRFLEMAFGEIPETEKSAIRKALQVYCDQDAEGMSGIVDALRALCEQGDDGGEIT